jgi:hypothetical protein
MASGFALGKGRLLGLTHDVCRDRRPQSLKGSASELACLLLLQPSIRQIGEEFVLGANMEAFPRLRKVDRGAYGCSRRGSRGELLGPR